MRETIGQQLRRKRAGARLEVLELMRPRKPRLADTDARAAQLINDAFNVPPDLREG